MDFTIERLLLLPGTFDVTASLYDYSLLHAFDFRHRALRFDVDPGLPRETHGVISMDGAWHVSEAVKRT